MKIVKVLGCVATNLLIQGLLIILFLLAILDFNDGYLNPGVIRAILIIAQEILLLVTSVDLLLMTIHHIAESVKEEFLPKFYLGLPWNHLLKNFTAELWFE